jgi:hypothetical protein
MPAAQSESTLHGTAWQIILGTGGVVDVVIVGGGAGATDTVLPPEPQPA